MNIQELIKENPLINITISGKDLTEWGNQIAEQTIKSTLEKKPEKLLSAKQIEEIHNISPATRIRWTKLGILTAEKKGQRIYYPESQNQSTKE